MAGRIGILVAAAFLLGGCGGAPALPGGEQRVDFVCPADRSFTVFFSSDRSRVRLIYGGTERRLERAPGESVELYTADAIYFGSTEGADGSREGFVAEGETVVLQDCRGRSSGLSDSKKAIRSATSESLRLKGCSSVVGWPRARVPWRVE